MRLGIFGGTFDPIHMGHLILAEHCRAARQLDRVLFVPAGQPPHKAGRKITPGPKRLEMVQLAIAGHPSFAALSVEIERTGPSYSVNTLSDLASQNPNDELFFLMGSDGLADLPLWYQPQRIAELATIVVATRPGSEVPDVAPLRALIPGDGVERLLENVVEIPLIQISSSEIRRRAAAGKTIRYLVPRAVECYIEENKLYTS